MGILLICGALFFTYIFASDSVFLGLHRLLRKDKAVSSQELFWLTRGAGPVVISWLTYNLFLFSPHQPPGYYLGIIGSCFVLTCLLARHELPVLFEAYAKCGRQLSRLTALRSWSLLLLICIGGSCLFILLIGIGFPIVGHDSLVHAIDARIMRQDMSLQHYLAHTEPDPYTGYLPVAYQLPFLQTLYLWFSLVVGGPHLDLVIRTVSPLFGLHCLLLLGVLVRRHASLHAALWAVFLLAVTPLFLLMSYDNAQDTPRYYFALIALLWFAKLIEAGSTAQLSLKLIVGMFAGFAIYSHLLGAPAVSAGLLGLVFCRKQAFLKNLLSVLLISVVAVLTSASYHYLASPSVQAKLTRTFRWSFVEEWTTLFKSAQQGVIAPDQRSQKPLSAQPEGGLPSAISGGRPHQPPPGAPPHGSPPTTKNTPSKPSPPPVIKSRGQGNTPLEQFLLGRLQMFTGIESFGFLFFVFWVGLLAWLRRSAPGAPFELLLFASALVYTVVILSGVRRLSWSNPRYIGSLIVIGAYFSGPLLARIVESAAARSKRLSRMIVLFLVIGLSFPAVLVTTVRGAKVGITNTGTFYTDVRSLRWLDSLRSDPITALSSFWRNYVGIRQTIHYALASEADKLKHAHDYFAAIQYFNTSTPADACALVFREGRYFYYAQRRGVAIADRSLYGTKRNSAAAIVRLFAAQGITHILIDSFLETSFFYPMFRLNEILSDPTFSECVYEFKSARVYRLRLPSNPATSDTLRAEPDVPPFGE